jgi:hypothetical protein
LFNKNHTNSRNDYTEDDIIKMMEFFKVIQLPISMLRTIHETNEPITGKKRKGTENEKRTNDTRKRNERTAQTIRNIC